MDNNITALTAVASSIPVTATGGSEIVVQLFLLVVTAVIGILGYFAMKWLRTSEYAKKYNLDNERTERILVNAIDWVNNIVKKEGGSYLVKHKLSISYFNSVAPDLVKKYGDALNDMVTRKMAQMQNKVGAEETAPTSVVTEPVPDTTNAQEVTPPTDTLATPTPK